MRILMVTQFFPPIVGGEEHIIQHLSRELVKRGHEVAVATLWHPGSEEYEVNQGVRIYRIRSTTQRALWLYSEPGRTHVPPLPDPEAVAGIRKIITKERPDIVHAHNWLVYSFLPLKAWSKARLVLTLHDYSLVSVTKRLMYQGAPCSGPALFKCLGCAAGHYGVGKGSFTTLAHRTFAGMLRSSVDMYLPISHATAVGNGLPDSGLPYQVIPNFVPDDPGKPEPANEENLACLPGKDYLLFVGDASDDKGVQFLVEAYSGLQDVPPLVIIGRRLPSTPEVFPPNVYFMNRWPHSDVMAAWRRCSIGLVPSIWPEPLGMVALEAMEAGKPLIASRIGGLPDVIVDGETGLLIPPGDVKALQKAILTLTNDMNLRQRMGLAGKRRLDDFRASKILPRIEQVYQMLLMEEPRTNTIPQPVEGEGHSHV